jgi:hypothetical protein
MFLSHCCRNLFYFCHTFTFAQNQIHVFMPVNYDSTNFCVPFAKDALILYRAVHIPLPTC